MATLYSTSALDLSVEKCLIDEYDLKIVSSSAAIQVGDSGDCSRVIFGSDTISMFSSYELNRKINYLKIICQVLPSNFQSFHFKKSELFGNLCFEHSDSHQLNSISMASSLQFSVQHTGLLAALHEFFVVQHNERYWCSGVHHLDRQQEPAL